MIQGNANATPCSVLLIEDNQHTREHLEKNLENTAFKTHAFGTYTAALQAIKSTRFDFLILDIGLPDGNGLELISPALRTNPDMLILVLTVFGQDEPVTKAIQAGAKGYLLKDQALDNISDVLLSMQGGASPIDYRVARALLQLVTEDTSESKRNFELSGNERVVLQHIAQGKLYKEIAYEMSISINTVREYVRRIYKKMDVNSRSKAIRYANDYGIKF